MKLMKRFINLFALLMAYQALLSQVINETYPAEGIIHFAVDNFNGDVDVTTYQGDKIMITADLLDDGYNKEIKWQHKREQDYLIFYLETPCSSPKDQIYFDSESFSIHNNWDEDCNWDCESEDPFPHLTYQIKIPETINLYLNTVMDGEINVTGKCESIFANNVNGSIQIELTENIGALKTVNGDINVSLSGQPEIDGELTTINGDISIYADEIINIRPQFKTMMGGDFYTDFDQLEVLPMNPIHKTSNGSRTKIDIGSYTRMNLGEDGPVLQLETFNGNVYFRKSKK